MVKGKTSRYANDRHTLSISTISPYSYTSFPSPSPYLLSPSLPSLATTPLLLPQAHVVSTAHVLYQTNKAQTQSALGTSTLNRLVHLPAATTRNPMSAARYLEEHQGASWSQFIIIMALFCAKQSSENQSTREYPLSELAVISSKQLHPNHYLEPFMPVFHIPSSPLTPHPSLDRIRLVAFNTGDRTYPPPLLIILSTDHTSQTLPLTMSDVLIVPLIISP